MSEALDKIILSSDGKKKKKKARYLLGTAYLSAVFGSNSSFANA